MKFPPGLSGLRAYRSAYLCERNVATIRERRDDEAARVADELEGIDELGVADAHDALLLGRPKVAHLCEARRTRGSGGGRV